MDTTTRKPIEQILRLGYREAVAAGTDHVLAVSEETCGRSDRDVEM